MPTGSASRLLVLSDLHAYIAEPSEQGPSALNFHGPAPAVDAIFKGVVKALGAAGVDTVDAVICPGDLTDKCDPTALGNIWGRLCELANTLDAMLIATAGNHDYDSRAKSSISPKDALLQLSPPFPTRDLDTRAKYFAYEYARTEVGGRTFITLNSAAYGGLGDPEAPEYLHGRVSKTTVELIAQDLAERPATGLRVLVVHHHPTQLPYIDLDDRSQIRDAELLLEALADDGPWLIIHGHKHRPWIQYASGGGGSAVLFGAGSFAATLDGVLARSARNQFYLIDLIDEAEAKTLGFGAAGRFVAWTHVPIGADLWVPAGHQDGLPSRGGFGWRASPHRLALNLADCLAANREWTARDLFEYEPRCQFLSPDDWRKTEAQLRRIEPDARLEWDSGGCLVKLVLLAPVGAA